MKRFRGVVVRGALAMALVLGACAAPAHAQTATEAELTSVMAKNEPYVELIVEAKDILLMCIAHINAGFQHAAQPLSQAEAQAWSDAWEIKARARLSAAKERLAKAPRLTVEEVEAALGGPEAKGIAEIMASNPKLVEDTLAATEKTLDRTAALAPLAATGDAGASDKLAREMFAVSLYMVEIENQSLRTAIATLDKGHPQVALAQSILSSNMAAAEIQRAILRLYNEEPLDTAATAKRARAHLADAEAAARRIPGEAKAMTAALEEIVPKEGEPLLKKMRKAFATYPQSTQVELKGIRSLNEVVSALESEDFETVISALGQVRAAYEQRIPLQLERTAILSR